MPLLLTDTRAGAGNPRQKGLAMDYCGIRIKRHMITEHYTAENGDHVSVSIMPDETAVLYVCAPVNNAVKFHQKYKTRRGAVIAMHRKCGKCAFNSMSVHYSADRGGTQMRDKLAYDMAYAKAHVRRVQVPFNDQNPTDMRVLDWLKQKGNMTAAIKTIILEEIDRKKADS